MTLPLPLIAKGLLTFVLPPRLYNRSGGRTDADTVWRMIRGGRSYLINRHPLSAHLAALERAGFDVVEVLRVARNDGIGRDALAPRFHQLTGDDLSTAGAFVIARKPHDRPA